MSESETNYMDLFFEKYILFELGNLSDEEFKKLNELNLFKVYNRNQEDWTQTIASVLDFSETIDIAIWHLWIKNSRISKEKNREFSPNQFASEFIYNYYTENSKVDVWENNQLEEAKQIIKEYKENLKTKSKVH